MKLNTWTIYKGKDMKNIDDEIFVAGEFPFILLRPDLNKPGRVLGLVITDNFVTTHLSDLQNRPMGAKNLYEIFQDKLGLIEVNSISEYKTANQNFSSEPIREENVKELINIYSIFIKSNPIEFDSEDYSTMDKIKSTPEIFSDMNLLSMPLPQLLNTLNGGLESYNKRMKELRQPELPEEERIQKTLQLSTLQSNLILFYDATIKQMDSLVEKQADEIKTLNSKIKELTK